MKLNPSEQRAVEALGNVSPRQSLPSLNHGIRRDTKPSGDNTMALAACADFAHDVFRQNRVAVHLTERSRASIPALGHTVRRIVLSGSEEQVARSNTARVVARVAHEQSVADLSPLKNPRNAVRASVCIAPRDASRYVDLTVPLVGEPSGPDPALGSLVYPIPEMSNELMIKRSESDIFIEHRSTSLGSFGLGATRASTCVGPAILAGGVA